MDTCKDSESAELAEKKVFAPLDQWCGFDPGDLEIALLICFANC